MTWKNDQVSEEETEHIIYSATSVMGVEGDFVEMGCYKGDTSLMLAEVVEKSVENPKKRLWIYDSFEGLPEKTGSDESILGKDFVPGALTVSKREVKERFLRAGLKVPIIKKAWFDELTFSDMPEKIAFAFLDGDFYESIRDSLKLVGPLMGAGGMIIIHDYNNPALPGVKKAVDEWIGTRGLQVLDTCAIIEVK